MEQKRKTRSKTKEGEVMGKKSCWVAKRYRKGWKLGLSIGSEIKYLNYYLDSEDDVKKALGLNIVFVHMKDE